VKKNLVPGLVNCTSYVYHSYVVLICRDRDKEQNLNGSRMSPSSSTITYRSFCPVALKIHDESSD